MTGPRALGTPEAPQSTQDQIELNAKPLSITPELPANRIELENRYSVRTGDQPLGTQGLIHSDESTELVSLHVRIEVADGVYIPDGLEFIELSPVQLPLALLTERHSNCTTRPPARIPI